MARYRFHTTVHARPLAVDYLEPCEVDGRVVRPLHVTAHMLSNPMAVSFEEAAEALEKLPRMFLEPDGSFVWVASSERGGWQVDGNLYDRGGRLIFVDLRGECDEDGLSQMLLAFGCEQTPVMFQMIRQAIFLDEVEFRRFTAYLG